MLTVEDTRTDPLRFMVTAAAFACVALSSQSAWAKSGIVGKDGRKPVPPKHSETARGIGLLLDLAEKKGCTAFCVAPHVIATNAHCLRYRIIKRRLVDIDPRNLTFFFMKNGKIATRVSIKVNKVGFFGDPRMSFLTGDPPRGGRNVTQRHWLNNRHEDWGLAKLHWSACKGNELKFADVKLLQSARQLKRKKAYLIGFHRDKKKGREQQCSDCRITKLSGGRNARRVEHNCDFFKGASGSPILVNTKDGPRVVAIASGHAYWRRLRRLRSGRTVTVSSRVVNFATHPARFLDHIAQFETAEFFTKYVGVGQFQVLLKQRGLYAGKVDGKIGPKTKAALVKFERESKMVPLGIPTVQLFKLLGSNQ